MHAIAPRQLRCNFIRHPRRKGWTRNSSGRIVILLFGSEVGSIPWSTPRCGPPRRLAHLFEGGLIILVASVMPRACRGPSLTRWGYRQRVDSQVIVTKELARVVQGHSRRWQCQAASPCSVVCSVVATSVVSSQLVVAPDVQPPRPVWLNWAPAGPGCPGSRKGPVLGSRCPDRTRIPERCDFHSRFPTPGTPRGVARSPHDSHLGGARRGNRRVVAPHGGAMGAR